MRGGGGVLEPDHVEVGAEHVEAAAHELHEEAHLEGVRVRVGGRARVTMKKRTLS